MIYLASPYSHNSRDIRQERFCQAVEHAAMMMRAGEHVFSPIAHTHPIASHGLPKGFDFWESFDRWYIERCDKVVVLMLRGWEDSNGVEWEVKFATDRGMPVYYLDPDLHKACVAEGKSWILATECDTTGPRPFESVPIMRWFVNPNLPPHLQRVAEWFERLAKSLCIETEPGPEQSTALRKLLEAKDAAVRATVRPGG